MVFYHHWTEEQEAKVLIRGTAKMTKKIAWCNYCMLHMSTSVFQDAVGPQKISTDSETTNLVHIYICIIQWNPSITDTLRTQNFVRYNEVSLSVVLVNYNFN